MRGDALFGKRTFLVRHGRRWTCAFSACCWAMGTVILLRRRAQADPRRWCSRAAAAWLGVPGLLLDPAPRLLGAPARQVCHRGDRHPRARGALLLLAHLSMVQAGWPAWRYGATIGALAVLIAGQAVSMARHGPVTRVTIPVGWDIPATRSAQSTELSATAVARDDTQSSRPPGVAGTSTACS